MPPRLISAAAAQTIATSKIASLPGSLEFTGHSARHVDTAGHVSASPIASSPHCGCGSWQPWRLRAPSCASAGDAVVAPKSTADVRARVAELVNAARSKGRKCGSERFPAAPPLIVSPELNEAAEGHARDMARKDYFEHRGADGSQPKDRVLRAGYKPRLTGENIALGPESAEEVIAGWLASPGHCANIMDSRFQHIGVGLATGSGARQDLLGAEFRCAALG